jgi:hypothetical protein
VNFKTGLVMTAIGLIATPTRANEYMVYSVLKALDFGNPGETPQKDYYVNVGSEQGVATGNVLEVVRRAATYDLTTQKLYKDAAYPIARLKVIHTEPTLSIARLESMNSAEKTPVISPRSVMVGDLVRPVR